MAQENFLHDSSLIISSFQDIWYLAEYAFRYTSW